MIYIRERVEDKFMSGEKIILERRKHKRFDAYSGVFAVNSHFGLIVNISLGGLAFRYVDKGEWGDAEIDSGALFGEDDLWINDIPIKNISECVANDGVACKSTTVKRRSVQFGELTPDQQKLLESFIWVNTKGAVEATHTV